MKHSNSKAHLQALASVLALVSAQAAHAQVYGQGYYVPPAASGGGSGTVTSVVCPSATITTTGNCNPLATTGTSGDVVTATGTSNGLQDSGTLLSSVVTLTGSQALSNKTLTAPILGTPASGTLTNTTGLPIATGISGLGTGVATAMAATPNATGGVETYAGLASPPAIGNTTAAAGNFTTVGATGLISPTSTVGIKGTTTSDNAQAGSVGEYICAQVTNGGSPTGCQTNSSTPVSLTSTITANVTSISLTAGDWNVWGNVITLPSGTTTQSSLFTGISLVSGVFPTQPANGAYIVGYYPALGNTLAQTSGETRISISATTTVYLVVNATFAISTEGGYGFIGARRLR